MNFEVLAPEMLDVGVGGGVGGGGGARGGGGGGKRGKKQQPGRHTVRVFRALQLQAITLYSREFSPSHCWLS